MIASGRLHISLTRVSDRKNFIVSEFCTKDDLIDALICSSFVPLYSGILPPKYRGVRFVDGALSDNIPILDDATITVSPFAGESDICPDDNSCSLHHISLAGTSIQMTTGNLYRMSVAFFPPSPEILSNMCRQGFDDALRYLQKNKLISCSHHLSIQSAIISSSPVKFRIPGSESFVIPVESDVVTMETDDSLPAGDSSENLEFTVSDGDDDDDDSDCISDCDECEERERFALQDSPPVTVQTALQAACDEVNRGFMSRIYKTKAYQALSLMATPYLLPFELAYTLVRKFYDWAPYMSEDMQWFIKGLYALIQDLISSLHTEGDVSSALTERGRVLREWGFTWEMRWGVHMKSVSTTAVRHPSVGKRPRQLRLSSNMTESTPPSPTAASSALNVNMGISVDYGTSASGLAENPLRCITEARRQVLGLPTAEHPRRKSSRGPLPSPVATAATAISPQQPVIQPRSSHHESCKAHHRRSVAGAAPFDNASCDSFDACLQAVDQMDAALAYYYADEKSAGTAVKVVEIFPLLNAPHHQHRTSATRGGHASTLVTACLPPPTAIVQEEPSELRRVTTEPRVEWS